MQWNARSFHMCSSMLFISNVHRIWSDSLFLFFQPCQLGRVHRTDSRGDLRQPASSLVPRVHPLTPNLPTTAHCGCPAHPRWPMGRSLSLSAVPWRKHQWTKVLQIHQGVVAQQSRFYGFILIPALQINDLWRRRRQIFSMRYIFIFRFYHLRRNILLKSVLFQIFFHFSYQLQEQ